jgi:gliding motility-associated-like protein
VNPRPIPTFPADPVANNSNPCLNQPGMVYNTQPGMNNYIWSIAGGIITAGGNTSDHTATVTWTGTGQQWISVKYTDPITNCEAVDPAFLNVNVQPPPLPTITGPATACLNSTGNVYLTQTGMTEYVWNVSGGTITQGAGTNIIHVTWTSSGLKQVCVMVTDENGCESAAPGGCFDVMVSQQPTPQLIGDISVCQKDIKTYSTQSGMTGYAWNVSTGGAILSGTGTNTITVQWFTVGNQTVAVSYNSTSNCPSATTTANITVKPLPFANFEADTVCLETVTPFSASTTTSNATYHWDFGDGGFANSTTPATAHLYANPGVFQVKLTVTGTNLCQKDTTKPILVLGKPVAQFITSANNCAEDSVSFTDLSYTPHGFIVKWIWNFGDGETKTINFGQNQNIKHKYSTGGDYPVTLFIKTSDSCSVEVTQTVHVEFSPVANFWFDTFACEKTAFQFHNNSQQNGGPPISVYSWNFGDPPSGSLNFSSQPDPTHSYTSSGTKSVLLLITNASGCQDSIRKTVTVNAAPTANFQAEIACEDSITRFEDLSTAPVPGSIDTWLWDFGDPLSGIWNTSTIQDPEHLYANPGTYAVTLLVTNSTTHCTKDTTINIVINQKPVAMFEYTTACAEANTNFTDLSVYPGSPFQQRHWNFGDPNCLPANNTSNEPNPDHLYSLPGTYQVTLKIKNLNGCTDTVTLPVTVKPRPTALFSYESVFCDSAKVYFFDQSVSAGAGIEKRVWSYASSIFSTLPNPTYTFPQPNMTYNGIRLIVTDKNSCSDTIIQSVVVKPPFRLGMVFDTVCFGQPTSFNATNPARAAGDTLSHFIWNFSDEPSGSYNTSDKWGPTHEFTEPGLYYVSLSATNSNQCTQTVVKPVRVYPAPEPDFTWQTSLTTNVTFNYDLSAIGQNVSEIWWDFGDGTPEVQDLLKTGAYSHTFPAGAPPSPPPPFNVCMKVKTKWPKDIPCEETKCSMVDIQPVTVGFTISAATLCDSVPVIFTDNSEPPELIVKWRWDFDDPDGENPILEYTNVPPPPETVTYVYTTKYNQPGLRRPKLTITTVTGLTKEYTYPAILLNPTSIVRLDDIGACRNDTVRFVLSDTTELFINNYHWEFDDNSDGDNIWPAVHKYKYQGIYNPTLTTTNSYGCTYTDTARITLGLSPVAAMLTNDPICERSETTIYDDSKPLGAKIVSWRWNLNDEMTAGTPDVSYTFHSKGQKTISLVVTDANHCSDTVAKTINVRATPVGKFTVTDNYNDKPGQIKMNNLSEESDTIHFLWDFGNGYKSEEREPVTSYSNDGLYTIRLRTYYGLEGEGCEDNTNYQYHLTYRTLYVPNAFKPNSLDNNYVDRLFKPVGANLTQYHIQLFDSFGRLMWESTELFNGAPAYGWDGTYNGELMPQGNYVWRITATFAGDIPWEGTTGGNSSVKKTSGTFVLLK